jgi:hypothetical protein
LAKYSTAWLQLVIPFFFANSSRKAISSKEKQIGKVLFSSLSLSKLMPTYKGTWIITLSLISLLRSQAGRSIPVSRSYDNHFIENVNRYVTVISHKQRQYGPVQTTRSRSEQNICKRWSRQQLLISKQEKTLCDMKPVM